MKRIVPLMMLPLVLMACQSKKAAEVFTPTPYPEDFAVVIDESKDTYYARQDIRQVISANELLSSTTYMILRDYDDKVATSFTQETPLTALQVQNMWNEVEKNQLLEKDYKPWYSWRTRYDDFKRSERRIQIRAGGKVVEYKALNYFPNKVRELALQVQAVRLPLTQRAALTAAPTTPATTAKVTTEGPATAPVAPEAAPAPAPAPAPEATPETLPVVPGVVPGASPAQP